MPVRRLRTLKEAERAVWIDRDDPRLWPTIAAVWELATRLCPPHFPPGVYKSRSMAEVNRRTESWQAETVKRQNPGLKLP